jgi:hypothetical protein
VVAMVNAYLTIFITFFSHIMTFGAENYLKPLERTPESDEQLESGRNAAMTQRNVANSV